MRVEVLIKGGAISKDFTQGSDGSSRGSNDGMNQLIVRYRKRPSLVG